jgi:hypothetical protein
MASKDIINAVDVNNPSSTRRSADLLPGHHRTDKNTKFLASTLDQLIQQPLLERVSGYMGSKLSLNYKPASDQYIAGTTKLRNDYQLEPALVISDINQNIDMAIGYDDLINQLAFNNADVSNLDRLFRPKSYSYDPQIDWDKFVNFRQYYWMPMGPDTIEITGQQRAGASTYTVADSTDGDSLVFSPDGGTTNPLLTLYRGQTYIFNVNSSYQFYIKTAYVQGVSDLYTNVTNNGAKVGQVILTVDEFTPNTLFYFAEGNGTAVGKFVVKAVTENTKLDIATDILGKATYTSGNGVKFSNGMKVRFVGDTTPAEYLDKDFIVEGVGSAITLTDFASLQILGFEATNLDPNFDANPFDLYPFDDFTYIPLTPDYLTINRAAIDKNPWSRYNRWIHGDVITAAAAANGVPAVYPTDMRASRPIIEYVAGLQLYNFGSVGKDAITLIDNSTVSAFKTVEGANSYYVDGVLLEAGNRVIFNADTDPIVKGRVYEVKVVIINNAQVINLEEVLDTEPLLNQAVVVASGTAYAGTSWWFDGTTWQYGQQKTGLNQAPLWDLYDASGNRYADQSVYKSAFTGTKLFGYAVGTGANDTVLGFPLAYRNVSNVGEYLFNNHFISDTFTNLNNNTVEILNVANGYLKFNTATGSVYKTPWIKTVDKPIPILQYQVITADSIYIEIDSIDKPGYAKDLILEVFINDVKQLANVNYTVTTDALRAYVVSTTTFSVDDRVLIKLYTSRTPIGTGYYEPPINLTNNPLNGPITNFSFTELSDHVKTIVDSNDQFIGAFPGASNLRDLANLSSHGTRLVSHANPISFAHYFLGGEPNDDLITAIRKVAEHYNQFKANLVRHITDLRGTYLPSQALDQAMLLLNATKDNTFNYNYSDMLAYGNNRTTRVFTVSDPRSTRYNLASIFNDSVLSERAVLVYVNNKLLVNGSEYTINTYDPAIVISAKLAKGDVITVLDYPSTVGSFIPPTPTKLGLYPKFIPQLVKDTTYVTPQWTIQGHDGSITIAFGDYDIDPATGTYVKNDYRDAVILEYETRVYNNLKVEYTPELLNINAVLPGAFRTNDYSLAEITSLITPDFLKWAGYFGVDYQTNSTLDEANSFTFNYTGTIDSLSKQSLPGYWRGIYKYFYDTDRPHSHPWEMLGFNEQPAWWVATYGPAPYTAGNLVLWNDLEAGRNATTGISDSTYARPGLSKIIPVDDSGNLLSPTDSGLASTPIVNPNDPNRIIVLRSEQIAVNWKIGDQAPAETAWRRSSNWPFACQVLLALAKPADYSALMFDTSRMKKNAAGQYKYSDTEVFLDPTTVELFSDTTSGTRVLASGYSVFVIESGSAHDANYFTGLKSDLSSLTYRLMAKLGGFASKDKLAVGIDAVDPTSPYPGVLIPSEDYTIFFNKSNPIESLSVSGLIVQKTATGYSVRGYDKYQPYFTVFKPFSSNVDQTERVGGVSESFVTWTQNTTYNENAIVFYNDRYYRVIQRHNSDISFNSTYYQSLPYLPMAGGVGVSRRSSFDTTPTLVPYGTEYNNIQAVYDLIIGYGKWLESKGFVFDEYNNDLDQVLDWRFTAKEFLYWTTQNWSVNSVITLSPFANKIIFRSTQGVVDSIVTNFYEYSLLKADGAPFPKEKFTIVRLDGEFTLTTVDTQEGLFFARLNVTQKEHAIVMNNFTLFNDVVYDIETGYRQRRISLKGFVTKDWNGDFFSPGFVFDQANITDWTKFTDYKISDIVRFSGSYYAAIKSISGTSEFDITQWSLLTDKPVAQLLPNFEYKINQFEDFYSLDIDNFDAGQQAMAQHLIGYTPRPYLNYIIGDPIAQYKFYQGFIRDKGSRSSLDVLSKASLNNFRSTIDFNEEWAFRIGYYGGFTTYQELETRLESTSFIENPQIIEFTQTKPIGQSSTVYFKDESDLVVKPEDFNINAAFTTSTLALIENNFKLPVAGYVRFDDITATAYNTNSVLDIANNASLSVGNTIWLGFKENGEWDVLRVTEVPTVITAVDIYVPGQSLILSTYYAHQLAVGDLISVTRVGDGIDQCYIVQELITANQFLVLTTLSSLPSLTDPVAGLLFAFKSSRLSTFDDLSKIPFLDRWAEGENVWVDNDGTDNWAVYKKTNNYSSTIYPSEILKAGQHYGTTIVSAPDTEVVVVSSPDFQLITGGEDLRGRVFVLYKNTFGELEMLNNYTLNDDVAYYSTASGAVTSFGSSLAYNVDNNLLVVGAPNTSRVKAVYAGSNRVNSGAAAAATTESGVVKLSLLDGISYKEIDNTLTRVVITSNSITAGNKFGTSVALSNSATKLLVGAPGETASLKSQAGVVYSFDLAVTSGTSITITSSTQFTLNQDPTHALTTGSYFGFEITGNAELTKIAVSAPLYGYGITTSTGAVFIYSGTTATPTTITGNSLPAPMQMGDYFGNKIKMSSDGNYLVIASPSAYDPALGINSGVVDIFTASNTTFVHSQRISAPISIITSSTIFGYDISLNENADTLVITSLGSAKTARPTFDTYVERYSTATIAQYGFESVYINNPESVKRTKTTTFDGASTVFSGKNALSGTAHVYNRLGTTTTLFAHAQQLINANIVSGSLFGSSAYVTNNSVYIGAPATSNADINTGSGQLFVFDKIDTTATSWALYRSQDPLVDLAPIKRAITIDSNSEQIQDYLDIIDPIKGKILGTAAEDLRYMTSYDPAVYSLGITGVNIDSNTNWLDEHLGDLWWDLSTVKYVWYEQGELEYRKNNWNNIFPGSSIDVYEWVRSEYLPTEWAQLADSADGLTRGISGQPKFNDNSVISVKQVYNSVSNSFTNVYYYWIKNKSTVPANVPNRRKAAFEIAQEIADPVGSGAQFIAIIGPTSLMLANAKPALASEQINLNIAFDYLNTDETLSIFKSANRHTEWLLLKENDANSKPSWLLEKKLIDSLLGHDSIGNPVPDPALPSKLRYGVEIRPRQSLFIDRATALRNVIEFANSILLTEQITGQSSFDNLNAIDGYPLDSTYDTPVDDIYNLELISTKALVTAELLASVDSNGKITNVVIINPGYGYVTVPTVTINDNGTGAELLLSLDEFGSVSNVEIVSAGKNYTSVIELIVRPYTALVKSDNNSAGRWAIYEWNSSRAAWIKTLTQTYNTTLFWKYVDWSATDYDALKNIITTVASPYALNVLVGALAVGDYVKVQNGGDGRYLILRKTASTGGTFDPNWDLVYSENGTVQILDTVWNTSNTLYAWDEQVGFDQTEYDQSPDKEIEYILAALKNDIFVGVLKIYWNQLFFKAVRYAMSEQKFLDWAFKTTFISVVNNSGSLNQPATYKLESVKYYEDFLKEIKPYHTKIRSFTEIYTNTELTHTFNTDFDLPTYYNTATQNFNKVEFGNPLLLQYPWKSWYDNYAHGVETIELTDAGSGYTQTPTVSIVPAMGDTGHGATAVAFLSLGKISRIIVTNPGKGYTATPTVVIAGGGSTVLDSSVFGNVFAEAGTTDAAIAVVNFQVAGDSATYTVGNTVTISEKGTFWINALGDYKFTPINNWSGRVPVITYGTSDNISNILNIMVPVLTSLKYLVPARAYAHLGGSPVRSNSIRMRFDRVSGQREIGNQYVTDVIISDGRDTTHPLTWVPVANKDLITLTRNGILQLIDTYTILYSSASYDTQLTNSYTKRYAELKLNFIPSTGDEIVITYPKSLELYTAADRIQDYYVSAPGMPGFSVINTVTNELDLSQLMTGVEYGGLTVQGLPFNFSGGWEAMPWASTPWDNYGLEDGYTAYRTSATSTQTFKIYNLISTGTTVNAYIKGADDVSPNGVRIDGTTTSSAVYTLIGLGTGVLDRVDVLTSGTGYISAYTKLAISAPNTLGGTQATASFSVTNGTISGFTVINPGSGYTEAPSITITEAINPSNSTSTVTIPAYARAVLRAEFTTVNSTATTSAVTIPASVFTTTSTLVTFRYSSSDGTVTPTDEYSLDAVVSGGDLAYTTALGLRPSEIILDGGSQATRHTTGMMDDGFLNSINSYAPEECVPGQVQEALGISVYAQPLNISPIISNKRYWVDGVQRTFSLGVKPTNAASVIVVFNNTRLTIGYTVDYANNTITLDSSNIGWLSLTSMQLGSVGLLDTLYSSTSSSTTVLTSSVPYSDVGSVYVTVNGVAQTTSTYTLSSYRKRARLTVNVPGTIQAYLFNATTKSISEISESTVAITTDISAIALSSFVPAVTIGNVGPFHSQVIVSKYNGANYVRLKPPITTYYQVSNNQTRFDVTKSIVYPSGTVDVASLEVYVNGTRIALSGSTWTLDQATDQIVFSSSSISSGDAIAIVVKIGNEYIIENGQVILTTPASDGDMFSITSFTNHDPDFIRTERFIGNAGNRYTMQRPILNSSYVWVTYNGLPLMVNIDYTIDVDRRTVVIRNGIYVSNTDAVVITSFADQSSTIAYRMFRDMLGRTHYKRLSAPNTTKLAQALLITDTMIAVEDSSLLTMPDPSTNRPGVILVDRERIEFFEIRGNTLHQLRRSTLGTSPSAIHYAGTDVVDQGSNQTIPFKEDVQTTSTIITTSTQLTFNLGNWITFNTSTNYTDQVEVLYQGTPLLKPGLTTVTHDTSTYDSSTLNDIAVPYGFTITNATSILVLNFTPLVGARLKVTKRSARTWYNTPNTTLSKNTSIQANFLLAKSAVIPAWLSTSSYIATDINLYTTTSIDSILQDESGNPLQGI